MALNSLYLNLRCGHQSEVRGFGAAIFADLDGECFANLIKMSIALAFYSLHREYVRSQFKQLKSYIKRRHSHLCRSR
ncbi:hypothetical protein QUB63_08495 [Microcoleus sp. ARI1-B5]|uniref:hypothetical protein n=1 Tax=unclassified Microcoleus TaxID=2642155 RepID=UPI002FD5AD1E